MKKIYNVISLTLFLIIFSAYAVNAQSVSGYWADDYLVAMTDNKIMDGYNDGNLYPDQNVTRAEFSKMFVLSAGIDTEIQQPILYDDISYSYWAYNYIMASQIFLPGNNGKYRPDEYLTRIDMVCSLSYFDLNSTVITNDKAQFTDIGLLTEFQKKYLNYAVDNNYINGYPDKTFKPSGYITRAEAAAFLSRVFFNSAADISAQIRYSAKKTEANQSLIDGGMRGYTCKVYNNLKKTHDGKLITESLKYPFILTFSNYTDKSGEFLLKLFYDYDEININLGNNVGAEYRFNLNSMETIKIPLFIGNGIEIDDKTHKLTAAFFSDADKHAADRDEITDSYGICLDYEVAKPDIKGNFIEIPESSDYEILKDVQYSGVLINNSPYSPEKKVLVLPEPVIKAKKGENIDLYYYMGNYDDTTSDYAMILLLDWKQTNVNGQKIVYSKVKDGLVYGTFSVTAPSETGKYEICAICVPNPFVYVENRDFALQYSYRFTLEVQ